VTKRRISAARAFVVLAMTMVLGLAFAALPLQARSFRRAAAAPREAEAPAAPSASATASASASASASPDPAPAAPAASGSAEAPAPTLPTGKGLPVRVRVAVFFLDVKSFDDTKGEFDVITDVRMRWADPRLAYPATEAFQGYKEYRGKAADALTEKLWTPNVDVTNRLESAAYVGRRLRIFPDGRVESIARVTGKYQTTVDAQRFPFDRQFLPVELLVREETTDEVVLDFDREDVEWSRAAPDARVHGWKLGLVDMRAELVTGWNGDRYSRVIASLSADREATTGLAPIFIPLVASLLIPLLAIWMNRATKEGFEIEAFELANIGIGGLFSVIALSFAIYTSYGVIAGGDNTVTRLFGLNYATLAVSLGIVVLLFRYNLLHRWFGPYVAEEAFRVITWAMPVLTLATSVAFLMVAAA
jgi:hypothetical protein